MPAVDAKFRWNAAKRKTRPRFKYPEDRRGFPDSLCSNSRRVFRAFFFFFYGYCDDSEERIREEGTATSFVYLRERIKRFTFFFNKHRIASLSNL